MHKINLYRVQYDEKMTVQQIAIRNFETYVV